MRGGDQDACPSLRCRLLFGLLSYSLVLVAALVNIIVPGTPVTMMTFQEAFSSIRIGPSILFELIAGAWFLWKGLAPRRDARGSADWAGTW